MECVFLLLKVTQLDRRGGRGQEHDIPGGGRGGIRGTQPFIETWVGERKKKKVKVKEGRQAGKKGQNNVGWGVVRSCRVV